MNTDGFQRYDYGSNKANNAHYSQNTPPAYDLNLMKFPIAVFSGSQDGLAYKDDVKWFVDQIKSLLVFDHEYYMGHMSFAIAKDMSWFTVDLMHLINKANNMT